MTVSEFDQALHEVEQLCQLQFNPRLVHGNFSFNNVIVDDKNTPHLIDWGSAQGHLAEQLELSELLAFSVSTDIVTAFLRGQDLTPDFISQNETVLRRLQLTRFFTSAHWLATGNSGRVADLRRYTHRIIELGS